MIVYLLGKAHSGKSTVADYLQRKHGFLVLSLADPIKHALQDWFDFSDEQLWGESEHRNALDSRYPRETGDCLSAREALQKVGEAVRDCWMDAWINILLKDIAEIQRRKPNYRILVPDVRYRNEHEKLKGAGATGIRIRAPFESKGLDGMRVQHASEVEQDSILDSELGAVVLNDGTVQQLYQKIDMVLKSCRKVLK